MKNGRVGLGIFLLTVGVIWALISFKVISFTVFYSALTLWPLFLVVIGLSIIFRNKPVIKAVSWIALLAVLIVYGYYDDVGGRPGQFVQGEAGSASIEKEGAINGKLDMSLGAMKFNIDSNTQKLVEASLNDMEIKHSVVRTGDTATVSFTREKYEILNLDETEFNGSFHLSGDVVWDMNIKTGMVDGTIDFSNLKVNDISFKTGAANLKLVLGNKSEHANINIKSGFSNFELVVPASVGVRIEMNGALNGTNADELGWKKNGGTYTSPNYDSAASKYSIKCNTGAGNVRIITQ